jgi:hypothetical protein
MTLTKEMATSRDVSASRQQVSDAMADGWTYTPGTIHLGADEDGLVRWMADLNTRVVPEHPFMLLGQTTTAIRADRRRLGLYAFAAECRRRRLGRAARQIGGSRYRRTCSGVWFASDRQVRTTSVGLEASDANLHLGALNGGTAQLQQMLIFRPAPGMDGPKHQSSGCILAVPHAQTRSGMLNPRQQGRKVLAERHYQSAQPRVRDLGRECQHAR